MQKKNQPVLLGTSFFLCFRIKCNLVTLVILLETLGFCASCLSFVEMSGVITLGASSDQRSWHRS